MFAIFSYTGIKLFRFLKFQFCDSEDISDEELVQQGNKMEENTEEIGDAYHCIALTVSMMRDKVFRLALFHVIVKNKSTLFFVAFYFYVTLMVHKSADRATK